MSLLETLKADAKTAGYNVSSDTAVLPEDMPFLQAYLFYEKNIASPQFDNASLAVYGIKENTEEDGDGDDNDGDENEETNDGDDLENY